MAAMARAVHFAHEHGIVHRDLKPGNILLSDDRTVQKISDFGLARRLDGDQRLTVSGMIAGSPSYMAPEQTQQLANLGPLVDVYALGAVFYESLTGRPPFRGADMADTLLLVRSQLPIAPRTIQPNIPKDLETICLRCLEKEPHRRYKSAAALAEDLERWLDGRPILARPTPIWVAAWKWARRKPAVAAALAIAQVALLAITLSTLYYSKKLQTALQAADASERRAAANAQTTMEALKTLVFDVQNELKKSPQTRPLRNRILESALKGLDRVAKQNENEEPQIVRAQALMQMGTIFAVLGQRDKALEALTGARKTADAVLKLQPNDNVARLAWAEATRVMGHNLLVQSKPEEARKFFDELVERTTSWNRGHSLSGELRWTHLLAFELQGSAAQWIHDFDTAEKCFSAMLAEAQRWAAADSAALAPRAGIARATHLQAALARDRGNLAQAERLFAQSLDGYQDVVKADPANGTYKAGIIINLFNLASLAWDRRDFATARDFIQRALAMHRDRAKIDPDSVDIALEVVETLFMAGRIELDDGRVDRALPLLEEAQQLLEALDQAGKIANRPVYQVERRQQIAAALDKCKEK
jgi:tetratricopeptide (TPR) repeat protein